MSRGHLDVHPFNTVPVSLDAGAHRLQTICRMRPGPEHVAAGVCLGIVKSLEDIHVMKLQLRIPALGLTGCNVG